LSVLLWAASTNSALISA